ncbi:MAG: hypothetical protein DRI86_15620 [Bacteroidetes bacterium]|nr:MAG: hypothetical protein DRI86_15620 [Bacteroidota bacterium]
MKDNSELRNLAKVSLQGNWGGSALVAFVYLLITGGISSLQNHNESYSIINLLIGGPLYLGITIFFLKLSRGEETRFENMFDGFKMFGKALGTYLLMILYIFLWTLLLIIPGIIAALSYSMSFFILADNPNIRVQEALKQSKEMMNGYKMKYFLMQLGFFGLALLCILTLGIGFLWLFPFMQVTNSKFYDDIKYNRIND